MSWAEAKTVLLEGTELENSTLFMFTGLRG